MARLLADEDVYRELIDLLRASGHDVLAIVDLPYRGIPDHLLLTEATMDQRTILTHNWRDFLLLHQAWRDWSLRWAIDPTPEHAGILAIPQKDVLSAADAASRVDSFLHENRNLADTYYRLMPARGWVSY